MKLVSNLDYFFHDMIEIQKVDTDTEGPALVNRLPFSRSAIREEHKAERRMRNAEMEAFMITVESLVELNIMEPLQEHKPLSYCKLYQNKTGNFKVKAAFLSVKSHLYQCSIFCTVLYYTLYYTLYYNLNHTLYYILKYTLLYNVNWIVTHTLYCSLFCMLYYTLYYQNLLYPLLYSVPYSIT